MKRIFTIYKDSFDGLNGDVWLFALMMLINRIGTLILPFLTLYITSELGWSKIAAGTGAMWFGIGALAGALLGGEMTDRFGYYKTMVFSLFSASIAFYVLQFVDEFYMLCGLLFLSSMLADIMRPALWSGLTFFTDKSNQTRAVSLLRMAFNAGFSIGPAFAGILIEYFGYSLIFTIDGLTCFAAGIFMLKYIKNDREKELAAKKQAKDENGTSPYLDGVFMTFLGLNLLMLIGFFQILSTVPMFMKDVLGYGEKEVGYFYAVNGLLILIIEMPLVHYMENYYSKFRSMIIGALMMGVSVMIFIFPVPSLIMIIFYTLLVSIGEIINFPFISSASMDRATKGNIGKYMSVTTVIFSLALIIAPIAGTSILEAYGYTVLFISVFAITLISVIGLHLIEQRFTRKLDSDAA